MITARTLSSRSASSRAASTSRIAGTVKALSWSARLKVMVATRSSTSYSVVSNFRGIALSQAGRSLQPSRCKDRA
jgi:hypothetical protein